MNLRRAILVEDDVEFAAAFQSAARGHFDCDHASTAQGFRDLFARDKYGVSVIDVRLEIDREGLDLVRDIRRMAPSQRIVLISAFWNSETRLEGLFSGAHQYIDKNRRDVEQIVELVGHEIDKALLLNALDSHRARPPLSLQGASKPIRELAAQLDDIELRRPRIVLIEGEMGSGVGDAAARLYRAFGGLHQPRAIDLASYCEGAGHEPDDPEYVFVDLPGSGPDSSGLLSGAAAAQVNRKTVFMHRRVANEPAITATIDSRLGLLACVSVPPLRDRKDDIGTLAVAALERAGIADPEVDPEALRFLRQLSWPGNVRELIAIVSLASISMKSRHGTSLSLSDFRDQVSCQQTGTEHASYRDHLITCEMQYLEDFLSRAGAMTQVDVARHLGYRDIATLRRHIERANGKLEAFAMRFPLLTSRFRTRRSGGR